MVKGRNFHGPRQKRFMCFIMARCTIGRVFTLVLVAISLILTAILLSDYDSFHKLESKLDHHSVAKKGKYKPLLKGAQVVDQSVANGVKTFLMFIGYPRSGHSIVGSCIDAHPDAIVAHEFNLMAKLMQPAVLQFYRNRTVLFNYIYQNSFKQSLLGWRSPEQTLDKKGYSLTISSNHSWQGKFQQLRLIGDKSGGLTAHSYRDSPQSFISAYNELSKIVQVPIKVLHVVRNPYDIIATKLSYRLSERRGKKGNFSAQRPVTNPRQIMQAVKSLEAEVKAVQGSIDALKLETLELHYVDFILETISTMVKICNFLNLKCSKRYLQMCDNVAYNKPSKSRDQVVWTKTSRQYVDQLIKDYSFFKRYSFTDL